MTTPAFPSPGLDRDDRRALVAGTLDPPLDGIDFVEVVDNRPGTPGRVAGVPAQRTLLVHLLRGPVPADLHARRVQVAGGVRPDPALNPVRVLWAASAADVASGPLPAGVTAADRTLVVARVQAAVRARVLVVRTSSSGDWSTYLLRLLGPGGNGVPAGFDEPLATAPFGFKVDCPSDLDCAPPSGCPPLPDARPPVDYLARDYEALRTRLLDRVSTSVPGWDDRSPADEAVTVLELFACLGDRLAYWQDAVATEGYLGTARRRTSARRHARLLDHRMSDGCSARTWLALATTAAVDLPAGSAVATEPPGVVAGTTTAAEAVDLGAEVFETVTALRLRPARNLLALHAWGDEGACLPTGTTTAFLAGRAADADPELRRGDVLVLAECGPDGDPRTGDPGRRACVRLVADAVAHVDALAPDLRVLEVHWHSEDALPLPLRIARRAAAGGAEAVAAAYANVVLADAGGSVVGETLDPPQVPATGRYGPRLRRPGLTSADPYDAAAATRLPATAALRPEPSRAVPELELDDGARTWTARGDLLASGRLATHVVVEQEGDGVARLRFGDGVLGRRPVPGAVMSAWYRVGGGAAGNVAAGTLTALLRLPDGSALAGVEVTNPLPAAGGVDAEPVEAVRQIAPRAFRTQLRAVTPDDHVAAVVQQPGVQRAVARRRWTGSWYAMEVTVDAVGGRVSAELADRLAAVLDVRRMAGIDVEVAPPVEVALDIVLTACVAPGHLRADVARVLGELLGSRELPGGRRGFFHPDRWTFGQPLFLSDLVAVVMAVPGVAWVDVDDRPPAPNRFARRGRPPAGEATTGRVAVAAREVIRVASDPNAPEAGRVDVRLRGGL